MFDETSLWWSLEAIVLPSSGALEENLQQRLHTEEHKQESGVGKSSEEPQTSPERSTSPWRNGVYQQTTPEGVRPSQLEVDEVPQQLR